MKKGVNLLDLGILIFALTTIVIFLIINIIH